MFPQRTLKANLPVIALISLLWFAFFQLTGCPTVLGYVEMFAFSLSATLTSYLLLNYLGYFDPLRLLPRKSNIVILPIAVLLGGLIQYYLFNLDNLDGSCSLTSLYIWAPILSILIFGGHYLFIWNMMRAGKKRRIILNLAPVEKALIIGDFATLDGFEYFEFLSLNQLDSLQQDRILRTADLIVLSEKGSSTLKDQRLLVKAHVLGIPIIDYKSASSTLTRRVRLEHHCPSNFYTTATQQTSLLRMYAMLKIVLEPALAVLLAITISPLLLSIGLIVKLTSPGPALYRQIRTGYLGKNFYLYKFRSMKIDAEANGPQFSYEDDVRVTTFGRFLRKTRLDELPQLWNVIRGEMSFIGPRPERPEIYEKLSKQLPMFNLRTTVKPGVTGWAQVYRGYVGSLEESSTKLEFDLYYIQHMSPRLDLIILVKTIFVALFGSDLPGSSYTVDATDDQLKAKSQSVLSFRAHIQATAKNIVSESFNGNKQTIVKADTSAYKLHKSSGALAGNE